MSSSLTTAEAASLGIKLRESCDACLQAKVKCGKGRPFCARCLSNGADCHYSPSARAGRKNRNSTGGVKKPGSNTASHKRSASIDIPRKAPAASAAGQWPLQSPVHGQVNPIPVHSNCNNVGSGIASNLSVGTTHFYGTTTPPLTSDDEALDLGAGQHGVPILPVTEEGTYNLMPTPPFHNPEFPDDFPNVDGPMSASTTLSFPDFNLSSPSSRIDQSMNLDGWMNQEPTFEQIPSLPTDSFEPSFFASSSSTNPSPKAQIHSHVNGRALGQDLDFQAECDCFADCLQSLQDLHVKSWSTSASSQNGPPFDIVLQLNNAAINATSKMLTCVACSTRGGVGISTMLMATMFGKALSLYRAAVHNRFGPNGPCQDLQTHGSLAFGAYRVDGEDRHLLEIEILLFELKKVEKTMKLWRGKSQHLAGDKDVMGVFEALAMYLDTNLRNVTDFLRQRRLELCQ